MRALRLVIASRRTRPLLLLAVSLTCLAWFTVRQDPGALAHALTAADPLLAAGAVGAYVASLWLRALRWRDLLVPAAAVPAGTVFRALTVGTMINNLLPAKAGTLARIHFLHRYARVRPAATSGSLLLEMLLDLVVLLAIVAAALALVDLPPGLRLSAQVLAGLMGVAVALLAVALRARDTVARLAAEPLARCPDALAAFLRESAAHLGAGIAAFAGVRTLARTGATSIATWGLMGAAYYLLGQALHVPISYPEMLLLAAVANLAVSVPAAAGGVGPFEVAMVQTLAALGAGGALGGAYVVALRGLLAGPVLALGLAALWWSRRRQRAAALTADALTAAANMSPPLAAGAPHLRVLPNDEAPAAMPRAA